MSVHLHVRGLSVGEISITHVCVDVCSCLCDKAHSALGVTCMWPCDWRSVGLLERAQWEGHVGTEQIKLDGEENGTAWVYLAS